MTLKEAYEYGQEQLKKAEIDDAILDAWYLLEHVTGVSRAIYFLDMNKQVSSEQEKQYRECVETRATHIPLQHITGVQEFMGLEFSVNEHVLVPRQDTEVLVESVLEILEPGMKVLDMHGLRMYTDKLAEIVRSCRCKWHWRRYIKRGIKSGNSKCTKARR